MISTSKQSKQYSRPLRRHTFPSTYRTRYLLSQYLVPSTYVMCLQPQRYLSIPCNGLVWIDALFASRHYGKSCGRQRQVRMEWKDGRKD